MERMVRKKEPRADRGLLGVAGPIRPALSAIRQPAWSAQVATTDDQAESAVLAILDEPPRIGVLTNALKLQVFTMEGRSLGFAPEIIGHGRFLRTSPGWIAAAQRPTDRGLPGVAKNAAQTASIAAWRS